MQLTWDDLMIQKISAEELQASLAPWSGLVKGGVTLVFLSRFGSWFLRRPEGPVETLDVFTGRLERVAESHEELARRVNSQEWQERHLLSKLVAELHQAGKIPGPTQCYALTPHPALGGPNPASGEAVDLESVMVMDLAVWQSLCVQCLRVSQGIG